MNTLVGRFFRHLHGKASPSFKQGRHILLLTVCLFIYLFISKNSPLCLIVVLINIIAVDNHLAKESVYAMRISGQLFYLGVFFHLYPPAGMYTCASNGSQPGMIFDETCPTDCSQTVSIACSYVLKVWFEALLRAH